VGDPALHEVASGFEHWIGSARHNVVIQALDIAQEVERRRLRRRGVVTVDARRDCFGYSR
jgi:hypothetical protein